MQTALGCQDMCVLVFVIMAEMASCPSLSPPLLPDELPPLIWGWLHTIPVAQMAKSLPAMQDTWVLSPGEENSYPLQYSCLENPVDRAAWQASPWGHKELDRTEQLSLKLFS